MLKIISKYLLFIVIFLLASCSTKKNTSSNRTYHNITAYYNVYFNGKEAYKVGIKKIDKNHVDNYSLILPVFTFNDSESTRSAFGDMNRAIEKGSKCIRKHSITAKPKRKKRRASAKEKAFRKKKEYNKWVDDAYLLIGKSNFIKGDYYAAIENLNFVVKEFTDYPIKYEGYVWLARTYTAMEKYAKASEFIGLLEADKSKLSESVKGAMYATKANILLEQQRYGESLAALERAIKHTKNKKYRVRYLFITAQLHQQLGENKKASDLYAKVMDMNPSYEMVFNAGINRATIYNSSAGDSKELQKQLYKMLKDDKNIDFQDQIYYALGKIAINESRDADAVNFYKKSVEVSTENTNQKAVSFLAIADVYFSEPDYQNSQAYYDSAVVILDKNYPNYQDIKLKSENLNALVENLNSISREDSLQRIAKLSERERNLYIDKIIAEIAENERLAKEQLAQQQQDLMYLQQQGREATQQQGSKWYFYNPVMLSMGFAEFTKKWGERKLEDHWRRKNKTEIDWGNDGNEHVAEEDSVKKPELSDRSREYYLADLPMTDSAIDVSNKKIEEAYFNIGNVYKDKFNDFDLSIESYLDLLNKYPSTEFTLPAYFNLYKLYKSVNDLPKSDYYKQKIIKEFPNSDYARLLTDPDFYKELQKKENQIKFLYQATYKYFLAGNCDEVINNYHYVDTAYNKSKLAPKFALLATLCEGRGGDTVAFKKALKNFVGVYPESEESTYAKGVLAALDRSPHEIKEEEEHKDVFGSKVSDNENIDISMFVENIETAHYYMVIVDNRKAEAKKIKFNLNNFNIDYYSFLEFEVSDVLLSANYTAVIVKSFKSGKMASNYFESVIIAAEVFNDALTGSYQDYIISADNFKTFYENKDIKSYNKFFEQFYPDLE